MLWLVVVAFFVGIWLGLLLMGILSLSSQLSRQEERDAEQLQHRLAEIRRGRVLSRE